MREPWPRVGVRSKRRNQANSTAHNAGAAPQCTKKEHTHTLLRPEECMTFGWELGHYHYGLRTLVENFSDTRGASRTPPGTRVPFNSLPRFNLMD